MKLKINKNVILSIIFIASLAVLGFCFNNFNFIKHPEEVIAATYTSDLCVSGTASADSIYSSAYAASEAFDNAYTGNADYWQTANTAFPHWLKYDFGTGNEKIVNRYTLRSWDYSSRIYDINNWVFQGSNDDSNWISLDTRAGVAWTQSELKTFNFINFTAYRYYRIYMNSNQGGNNYGLIQEMEMMGYAEGSISDCGSVSGLKCSRIVNDGHNVDIYTLTGNTTTSTTWAVTTGVSSVEYLVVGGGGGGGYTLGGGGAGGFVEKTNQAVNSSIEITVGAGGIASSSYSSASNGSNSSIKIDGGTTITAYGGGAGSYASSAGYAGGSGGGGQAGNAGGASIQPTTGDSAGYGYAGGTANGAAGGGGGGAGGLGQNYTDNQNGGPGGVGRSSSITGDFIMYAGGGGGASGDGLPKPGGSGGGGTGGRYTSNVNAVAGVNGLGGGGGGGYTSYANNANGGSGIVIIKYIMPPFIAQVIAVPSPTTDATPSYTFSSTEAGTITYGGDCSSSTTSATVGNNAITFNTLAQGTYSNCTIMVTDASSNQSNTLNVNTFIIATNSCWYCEHYYNTSNVLQAGKNGQLDFTFTYEDSNSSATLSGYRVAIDTENLSLDDIDSQADIISPSVSTWNAGGSAAPGATITYSGTSVKVSPSAELYQIGYGNGSTVKTYYWWVKVKNSSGIESEWIPGPAFNTPKKHYPIVRVVADKANIIANTNIQYCSGTDLSNQTVPASRDACYSVCWAGTAGSAVVDPDNANWKCSVCYNSSGTPVSCSTLNDGATAFTWKVPSGFVEDTDYALTSGTLSSANPIIKFLTTGTDLKMGLSITGSACAAEQTGDIKKGLPSWKEVSPF